MARGMRWSGLVAVFVLAAGLVGCVGSDGETGDEGNEGGAQTVAVSFGQPHEFGIELSTTQAPAGEVTFEVTNDGDLPHEFAIVKHEGAPSTLPVTEVNVDTSQLEVVGESGNLDPGVAATVTVDLAPGTYVIFSNTSGHYAAGMFAGFTVR